MPDVVLQGLGALARWLEIVGAGALVLGFVIATGRCFRDAASKGTSVAVRGYRQALGRVVLIGLEILVAATIIKTITLDPTAKGMSILAIMVAIRTTLGWTMSLEMSGRWPWQKPQPASARSQTASGE